MTETVSEARRYLEQIENVYVDNAKRTGTRIVSPYSYILQHGQQHNGQSAPDVKNWRSHIRHKKMLQERIPLSGLGFILDLRRRRRCRHHSSRSCVVR
jgi:hypothetical protein